jgi:2-phospho-L-lactate/phosphoenolpyruvate guanylyltransferase
MPTAAILPVKRFARAKQRLAPALGEGSRRALAAAMFADVLGALRHCSLIETVIVVSSEPVVRDAVDDDSILLLPDPGEKGQSHATLAGLARASALGYDRALLVPGDTPLIDALELDNLIANAALCDVDVIIVPDRHGVGTNAVLLDPASPFQPQFGPGSRERHEDQARRRGLTRSVVETPSLLLDIDTPEDLAELRKAFEQQRGRAPRTQGVIVQIERSRASAISA